jgi:hypothetical protein
MDQLKEILTDHARRYPLMEPTDAVKLIYQNEFGGGHLIRDEGACLAYLRREYESVAQSPAADLTESIGNGLVRVHLAALGAHSYSVEQLGADFIRSAKIHAGSLTSFLRKLELLKQLTQEGIFSFSESALAIYLTEYETAGYPMVSHSERYRQAYHPSYRILRQECLTITNRR